MDGVRAVERSVSDGCQCTIGVGGGGGGTLRILTTLADPAADARGQKTRSSPDAGGHPRRRWPSIAAGEGSSRTQPSPPPPPTPPPHRPPLEKLDLWRVCVHMRFERVQTHRWGGRSGRRTWTCPRRSGTSGGSCQSRRPGSGCSWWRGSWSRGTAAWPWRSPWGATTRAPS